MRRELASSARQLDARRARTVALVARSRRARGGRARAGDRAPARRPALDRRRARSRAPSRWRSPTRVAGAWIARAGRRAVPSTGSRSGSPRRCALAPGVSRTAPPSRRRAPAASRAPSSTRCRGTPRLPVMLGASALEGARLLRRDAGASGARAGRRRGRRVPLDAPQRARCCARARWRLALAACPTRSTAACSPRSSLTRLRLRARTKPDRSRTSRHAAARRPDIRARGGVDAHNRCR